VKGFHKFARHNWLVCKASAPSPTQTSQRLAELSHIKATVLILVLFVALSGHLESRVKAKAMKDQGKASNSGLVVIVISDDFAVRNSLNSGSKSKAWLFAATCPERTY